MWFEIIRFKVSIGNGDFIEFVWQVLHKQTKIVEEESTASVIKTSQEQVILIFILPAFDGKFLPIFCPDKISHVASQYQFQWSYLE